MKNVLILHRAGKDHTENRFLWLENTLEVKGYKVWAPDLSDSGDLSKDQMLNKIFSNKNWAFDSESVIIGHSAGVALILRILEKLPEGGKINKTILIACPTDRGAKPEFFEYKKVLLDLPFDWDKINTVCKDFYVICSDNDKYQCGRDQIKMIQENLGGEPVYVKWENHFHFEKGPKNRQFPLIVELLEK